MTCQPANRPLRLLITKGQSASSEGEYAANGTTYMQKPKPLAKQNLLKSQKTNF
jgi:hypothetical protein